MKTNSSNPALNIVRTAILLFSCLFLSLLARNAGAQTNLWWDNNGTSAATSGTWDTTTTNWSSSSALTAPTGTFANGDCPQFAAGSGLIPNLTITVNTAVTCAGMAVDVTGATVTNVTFAGTGSIGIVSGMQGFTNAVSSGMGNMTFNVPLTGPGGILQHGYGYIALYDANSYTGGTELTGGQIIYYNNDNSFGTGPITITGTGGAMVNGGTAAVTIPNNFSFPTAGYNLNLASGNPVAGAPGTTWTGTFTLPSGMTTLFTSSIATEVTEISGVISGIGAALTIADNGTMELGGVNTYSGATTISSPATLSIVGSGALGSGSYAGTIANGGTFSYNSSVAQTLSGAVSGTGALIQNGPGTLILSVANSYTGNTTINGGILDANVSGSISGSVVIVNGGTLELDSSSSMSSGVVLDLASAPANGVVNLNFSGNQNIFGLNFGTTSMAPGTYGASGNNSVTYQYAAFSGNGILNVTGQSAYWDPGPPQLDAIPGSGGTGNWDSTDPFWFNGSSDIAWPANYIATFAGTPGTVTLNANVTADGLVFATNGYTISGSDIITLAGTPIISISTNTATIGCLLAGTAGLTETGSGGTLTLTANNTYAGGTTIGANSTLIIGGAGGLNSGGAIANNGTFIYDATDAQTCSGVISGPGTLTENSSGTLTLSAANTYTGITTVNSGTLQITTAIGDSCLGTPPSSFVYNQITLSNFNNSGANTFSLRAEGANPSTCHP